MDPTCVSCGSARSVLELAPRGHASVATARLRRCLDCGLVFLESWTRGFRDDLYDYYADRVGRPKEQLYSSVNHARYLELIHRFEVHTKGRGALDVGCGQGQFVDTLVQAGWEPLGIDLSASAVRIGTDFGLPVRQLDFFSPELAPQSFDLITMFELIEHVPSPGRFIARAQELLRPRGLLYLTTPNFACIDRRVLGTDWRAVSPEHLSYFTPTSLRALVERSSSLSLLGIETKNVSLSLPLQLARRWRRRFGLGTKDPGRDRKEAIASGRRLEQGARARLEGSTVLRQGKDIANRLLDELGLGSAMIGLFQLDAEHTPQKVPVEHGQEV